MKSLYAIGLAASLALGLVFATPLAGAAESAVSALPAPWLLSGGSPKSYEIGLDQQTSSSGQGGKFIRFTQGANNSWGTLMQVISAKNYQGQRLRFQARVKTESVTHAELWMRVDSASKHGAAFYNSMDKPIVGSADWQTRSVTLDVPDDAKSISFGAIDAGAGTVWIDELSLEVVGKDVPVDVMPTPRALSAAPVL